MSHICREKNNLIRYDVDLLLKDTVMSKEQSEKIFGTIETELERIIHMNNNREKKTR